MALTEVILDGPLSILVLNRPDARNALSVEMCEDITVAVHGLEAEADARVVVLRGEGPAFCAGADFAAVSGEGGIDFLPAFQRMLEAVARCRLPTVASIHGAALGGGLQLASACDFRLVAADAKVGIPSARLGILVDFENIQRLVAVAGVAVAKEVLMMARTFTGEEAAVAGLATRAFPAETLWEESLAFSRELAALAPLSVQGSKHAIQMVVDARRAAPEAATEHDRLVAEAYVSSDLQEGLRAMAEKRPPNFTGH